MRVALGVLWWFFIRSHYHRAMANTCKCGYGGLCIERAGLMCNCETVSNRIYEKSDNFDMCHELVDYCKNEDCNNMGECVNTFGSFYCKCHRSDTDQYYGQRCQLHSLVDRETMPPSEGVQVLYSVTPSRNKRQMLTVSVTRFRKGAYLGIIFGGEEYWYGKESFIFRNLYKRCIYNRKYDPKACENLINGYVPTMDFFLNSTIGRIEDGNVDGVCHPSFKLPIGRMVEVTIQLLENNELLFNDIFRVFIAFNTNALACVPLFDMPDCINHLGAASAKSNKTQISIAKYSRSSGNTFKLSENYENPTRIGNCRPKHMEVVSKAPHCYYLSEKTEMTIVEANTGTIVFNRFIYGSILTIPQHLEASKYMIIVTRYRKGGRDFLGYDEDMHYEKKFWITVYDCPLLGVITGDRMRAVDCNTTFTLTFEEMPYISLVDYTWSCDSNEEFCQPSIAFEDTPLIISSAKCEFRYTFSLTARAGRAMTSSSVTIATVETPINVTCADNCENITDPRKTMVLTVNGALYGLCGLRYKDKNGETKTIRSDSNNVIIKSTDLRNFKEGEQTEILINTKGKSGSCGNVLLTKKILVPAKPNPGLISFSPKCGYSGVTIFELNFKGFSIGFENEGLSYRIREKKDANTSGVEKGNVTIPTVLLKVNERFIGVTAVNKFDMESEEVVIEIKQLLTPMPDLIRSVYQPSDGKILGSDFVDLVPSSALSIAESINGQLDGEGINMTLIGNVGAIVNTLVNTENMQNNEAISIATTAGSIITKAIDKVVSANIEITKKELTSLMQSFLSGFGDVHDTTCNARLDIANDKSKEIIVSPTEQQKNLAQEISVKNNLIKGMTMMGKKLLEYIQPHGNTTLDTEHIEMVVMKDSMSNLTKKNITFADGESGSHFRLMKESNEIIGLVGMKYHDSPFSWSETQINSEIVSVDIFIDGKQRHDIPTTLFLNIIDIESSRIEGNALIRNQKYKEIENGDYITVHKFILNEEDSSWGLVRFTFNEVTEPLKVLCLLDELPEFETINEKGSIITAMSKNFDFDATGGLKDSLLYFGIMMVNGNASGNFSFKMTNVQCMHWNINNWVSSNITVALSSDGQGVICESSHASLFSASLFTPPNLINPIADIHLFKHFLSNPFIGIVIGTLLLIGLILLLWTRKKDMEDTNLRVANYLEDNPQNGTFPYLIGVYTSNFLSSGTSANVCIKLFGKAKTTPVHHLKVSGHKVLQVGNDDWFVLFVTAHLGDIVAIELFHDDFGPSPDWYCNKIIIYDISEDEVYTFEVGRWISIKHLDEENNLKLRLETTQSRATILGPENETKDIVASHIVAGLRNSHNWLRIFIRQPRAIFTRSQLLITGVAILFLTMLVSMMFFGVLEDKPEDSPKLEVTISSVLITLFSFAICFPVGFLLLFFFEKSTKNRTKISSTESTNRRSSRIRKLSTKVIDLAKQKMETSLLPVTVGGELPISRGEKFWLATAWSFSILIILVCSFFMIFYSLKFGKNKSLKWFFSFFFGWLKDSFLFEPAMIIAFSFVLAFIFRKVAFIDAYHFNILYLKPPDNKSNTDKVSPTSRDDPIYSPLTQEEIKIHLYVRERVDMEKWLYSKLLTTVIIFCLTIILIWSTGKTNALYQHEYARYAVESPEAGMGLQMKDTYDKESFRIFLRAALPVLSTMKMKDMNVIDNEVTKLIGVPRLRQQRVKQNSSKIPSYFKGVIFESNAGLSYITEDTIKYFRGWEKFDKELSKSQTVWSYSNSFNTETLSIYGKYYKSFDGGGYIEYLDDSFEKSLKKLSLLERYYWFDERTRSVFLEYNIYNPQSKLFTSIILLAEYQPSGVYTTKLIVDGDYFGKHKKDFDTGFIITASLFIVFLAAMIILVFEEIAKFGFLNVIRRLKVFVDIFCCVVGCCCIITCITRVVNLSDYISRYLEVSEYDFLCVSNLIYHKNMYHISLGMFSVLLGFRMIFVLTDCVRTGYFRGFYFLSQITLINLFFLYVILNLLFNILTQYFGCRYQPGLINVLNDKKHLKDTLLDTGTQSEYNITVFYAYWYLLFKIICIAVAICLYSESMIYIPSVFSRKYQLKQLIIHHFSTTINKIVSKKSIEMSSIYSTESNLVKTESKFKRISSLIKKKQPTAQDLSTDFNDIQEFIKKRINTLNKISGQLDIIIQFMEDHT